MWQIWKWQMWNGRKPMHILNFKNKHTIFTVHCIEFSFIESTWYRIMFCCNYSGKYFGNVSNSFVHRFCPSFLVKKLKQIEYFKILHNSGCCPKSIWTFILFKGIRWKGVQIKMHNRNQLFFGLSSIIQWHVAFCGSNFIQYKKVKGVGMFLQDNLQSCFISNK